MKVGAGKCEYGRCGKGKVKRIGREMKEKDAEVIEEKSYMEKHCKRRRRRECGLKNRLSKEGYRGSSGVRKSENIRKEVGKVWRR